MSDRWLRWRALLLVLLGVSSVVVYLLAGDQPPNPGPSPVPTPSAVAPGPPCVHEVCAERPGWLTCVHAPGTGYCYRYRIDYEHHCACDAWGPLPDVEGPR